MQKNIAHLNVGHGSNMKRTVHGLRRTRANRQNMVENTTPSIQRNASEYSERRTERNALKGIDKTESARTEQAA